MLSYLLKRTARAVLTVWVVMTITFGLIRLLPGGPLVALEAEMARANPNASPEAIEQLVAEYANIDPNQPIHMAYLDYVGGLVQGDFGKSLMYNKTPVADLMAQAVPWTVFVVAVTTILAFAIGILMGAIMAYKEGTWVDSLGGAISILSVSTPFYILGILAVFYLGYQEAIFPFQSRVGTLPVLHFDAIASSGPWVTQTDLPDDPTTVAFLTSALYHGFLPIVSFTFGQIGIQALSMRGNSMQVLGEDYVRVARLRGLPDRRISTRYVARNAILPMYTGILLNIGFLLGGTVILEGVFKYQGLGYYMWQGLINRDPSLMMGMFLIITIALVVGIYVADLTYGFIDPRVAHGDSNEAY